MYNQSADGRPNKKQSQLDRILPAEVQVAKNKKNTTYSDQNDTPEHRDQDFHESSEERKINGNGETEEHFTTDSLDVDISELNNVTTRFEEGLRSAGYTTIGSLQSVTIEDLKKIKGIGQKTAEKLLAEVREYS